MNLKTKILGTAVIASLLVGAISVSAFSKPYSFEVHANLNGTTVFALENLSTNTIVKADTLDSTYKVVSDKSKYEIELYKSYLNRYPMTTTADNVQYTIGFGTVPAGNYTVNIMKTGSGGYYVNGSGTINQ